MIFARLIHSSGVDSILGFLLGLGRIEVQEKTLVPKRAKATDKYTSSFETVLKPTSVEALPYLIGKWMQTQADVHSKYPSKIMNLALAKLLTYAFANAAGVQQQLRNLECQGYVIVVPSSKGAKPGKRVTRQDTAHGSSSSSSEPQYTKIPLSTKILRIFLQEWKEWSEKHERHLKAEAKRARRIARQAAGEDEEEDEDEDDDSFDEDEEFEDEDSADDDAFIARMKGKLSGASPSPFAAAEDYPDFGASGRGGGLMTLSDMLDHHADEEELDGELEEEAYPESLTDPLNEIQLGPYLQNFLLDFAQAAGGACMQEAAQYLDEADKQRLQACLAAPRATELTETKKQQA